jgi:hypothetical protein
MIMDQGNFVLIRADPAEQQHGGEKESCSEDEYSFGEVSNASTVSQSIDGGLPKTD